MCGVAGLSPWLVRLPCAELGLGGSSFRFCWLGRCWPTPIHVLGERGRHDCQEIDPELLQSGISEGRGGNALVFVRPMACGHCPRLNLIFWVGRRCVQWQAVGGERPLVLRQELASGWT